MDCPKCKEAMITLELADVEVDHCVYCGGIWLDTGELEILMADPLKARQLLASFHENPPATEQARPCPICEKAMAKIIVGRAEPPVWIDKCRRSDGLWFDRGELQSILHQAQLDPDNRIQRLLADMFGQERQDFQAGSQP